MTHRKFWSLQYNSATRTNLSLHSPTAFPTQCSHLYPTPHILPSPSYTYDSSDHGDSKPPSPVAFWSFINRSRINNGRWLTWHVNVSNKFYYNLSDIDVSKAFNLELNKYCIHRMRYSWLYRLLFFFLSVTQGLKTLLWRNWSHSCFLIMDQIYLIRIN